MLRRYLYLKIVEGSPFEIKHFTDRSAGLKHLAERAGSGPVLPEAFWSDAHKRAHVCSRSLGLGVPTDHWLYEIEIF